MPFSHLAQLDDNLATDGSASIDVFKQCVDEGYRNLADRFHAGEPVEKLVQLRADFIDEILIRAWNTYMPTGSEAALIAVGGYGRRELHPASDVDVLLLTGDDPEVFASPLEQLVTLLWDIGLQVGHSVRSVEQCVSEAIRDVTVITNLMESRAICGARSLFERMLAATGRDRIWPSDEFFSAKLKEQEQRHGKFDDTAYNLEPNIKENPGGLRDIQMIGWVAKRHFGAQTMADLITHGFLTDHDYQALMAGQSHLWRIRFALHLLTGRHEDRLLFDYQHELAKQFGFEDDDTSLAVERFMQTYYRTVSRLNQLNEMLLQLFQEAILLKHELGEPVVINRRFQSRSGYLEVTNPGTFAHQPLALLEVFLIFQQDQELIGIRATTIRLIRAHRHLIDSRFRRDIRARSLFMEILRQPSGITQALRRMNRYGILARYIPAFGNIFGRMQYDLFHVYTVDEHTLRLIRNLRRFAVPELSKEFPQCSRVFRTIAKPELLYLAGIFHDIAKGRGGDHSLLGAQDAWDFCKLHDLSEFDAGLVSWLVEKHLLMSIVAQRKDIEDREVVREFAATVGNSQRLDYLYLLTVADIRATNPKRWNSWKNSLLFQLFIRTKRALTRGLDHLDDPDVLVEEKQAEARRALSAQGFHEQAIHGLWQTLTFDYFTQSTSDEIAWQTALILDIPEGDTLPAVEIRTAARDSATEVFIGTLDRDELFAHTTVLLAQLGLNVVAARIHSSDGGCAINSYFVLEEDGTLVDSPERKEEIELTLRIGLSEPDSFDPTVRRRVPRHLKHFSTPTELTFVQDENNQRTELRLRASDQPGLLSRVGQAFAKCGVRLQNAKITTLGAVAEDTYYISDRKNRPITNQDDLDRLANAIHELLSE